MSDHGATKLSAIANLASPSNAPLMLRFSQANDHLFQKLRSQSFPGGHSRERGGTIVADANGVLSVQNIGGLGSTSRNFSPSYKLKDGNKFSVVGFFHTHTLLIEQKTLLTVCHSAPGTSQILSIID